MGRIAEALKRAERERQSSMASPSADNEANAGGVAVAELPFEPDIPAHPFEEDQPILPPPAMDEVAEELVPYYDRSSLISEQYRSLRTRLLSQNPMHEHQIIAITSAIPKEGKSVTTLNLGLMLSEIRHLRVLVVDGDFRRSSLAPLLNQPNEPGLADLLAGKATYDRILKPTAIPNITFIPAGRTHRRSAAELLTTIKARQFFKRIQNDFHYTIVDTPPATTVTDVGIIGQMATGVILIARLHRTRAPDAKRSVRLLQANNIKIMGSLIIGRDSPTDRYGYAYGYGHNGYYSRYYNDYYAAEKEGKKS